MSCPGAAIVRPDSTFQAALPYVIGSIALSVAGTVIALKVVSTAAIIAGVAIALFGLYSFVGVVTWGVECADDPAKFQKNMWKMTVTAATTVLTDIVGTILLRMFL